MSTDERPRSVAKRLTDLFAGSEVAHGEYGEPVWSDDKSKWVIGDTAKTKRGVATAKMWQAHLDGKQPLGVIPVRKDDGTCRWGCIDLDEYRRSLLETVAAIERLKLPLVPVRSKSGGMHLLLFVAESVPSERMIAVLEAMAAQLGLEGCEVFPTQDAVEAGDKTTGNWIAMPYLGTTFDGKIQEQVGLRKTGAALAVEEFLDAAEATRLSAEQFEALATMPPPEPAPKRRRRATGESTTKAQGAAFAQRMLAHYLAEIPTIPPGERNNRLAAVAAHLGAMVGRGWIKRDEVRSALRSACESGWQDPTPDKTDRTIVGQIAWGEEHPHDDLDDTEAGNFPVVEHLTIVRGGGDDASLWKFRFAGGEEITMSSDDVANQTVFLRRCLARSLAFDQRRKPAYTRWLNTLIASATIEEPPPTTTESEAFQEEMQEFLINRQSATQRDDILTGRPHENEETGRFEFRLGDLQRYLIAGKSRFGTDSRRLLGERIRAMGGNYAEITLRSRYTVSIFWVPISAVRRPPRVPPPPMPEEPM